MRKTYSSVERAILDDQDPFEIPVERIKLSEPQARRLQRLYEHDQVTKGYRLALEGQQAPWDILADWGMVHQTRRHISVTDRGRRWVKAHAV